MKASASATTDRRTPPKVGGFDLRHACAGSIRAHGHSSHQSVAEQVGQYCGADAVHGQDAFKASVGTQIVQDFQRAMLVISQLHGAVANGMLNRAKGFRNNPAVCPMFGSWQRRRIPGSTVAFRTSFPLAIER